MPNRYVTASAFAIVLDLLHLRSLCLLIPFPLFFLLLFRGIPNTGYGFGIIKIEARRAEKPVAPLPPPSSLLRATRISVILVVATEITSRRPFAPFSALNSLVSPFRRLVPSLCFCFMHGRSTKAAELGDEIDLIPPRV